MAPFLGARAVNHQNGPLSVKAKNLMGHVSSFKQARQGLSNEPPRGGAGANLNFGRPIPKQ